MLIQWLEAFHLISVIAWFAGLFYLPRLFVYHSLSTDTISQERFKIMERRLYYGIMMPSLFFTALFGFLLVWQNPLCIHAGWFELKLFLVFTLILYHVYCGYILTVFKYNQNKHSHVFYRWLNEYPTIILIVVIILAIVKP